MDTFYGFFVMFYKGSMHLNYINSNHNFHMNYYFLLVPSTVEGCDHYENMPFQIYWKFYHPKKENFQIKNSDIFIFLLKTY